MKVINFDITLNIVGKHSKALERWVDLIYKEATKCNGLCINYYYLFTLEIMDAVIVTNLFKQFFCEMYMTEIYLFK